MTFKDYSTQVSELCIASLKSRYRKTFAGFLWVILNPLIMFGVQSLVFRRFLKLEMTDYYLFLLGGLLPWIFFTQAVQMGTPVFVSQAQLLRSFKINPWVVLGAQVLDGFINFLASFTLIVVPFYLSAGKPLLNLSLLPIAFIPLLLGTMSITITLSILNVFYRDINFVMGFVFSILFFLTPIFYPKAYVPSEFHFIVDWNPIIYFIEPFRKLIHDQDMAGIGGAFLEALLLAIGFSILSMIVWKRKQNDFYRTL